MLYIIVETKCRLNSIGEEGFAFSLMRKENGENTVEYAGRTGRSIFAVKKKGEKS